MIQNFSNFFLSNKKITYALIVIISLFGSIAYFLLPKQYNPTIVAPAFSITVPAKGYNSEEASQYVAKSLENTIKELAGVDKISSYSTNGMSTVLVSFDVGMSQEIAKTRLYDKISSKYDLRPLGIDGVQIKSIDPEELPQISIALTYSGEVINPIQEGIYLRNIATRIKEEVKQIPGTTVIDILGGYKNDISIVLDREKIEAIGLDILSVSQKIQSKFQPSFLGNLDGETKTNIFLSSEDTSLEGIRSTILFVQEGKQIILGDIATIQKGPLNRDSSLTLYSQYGGSGAVLLGIAKLTGSNAVFVVEKIQEKLAEIKEELPKNIIMTVFQNEGETAREATNELLFHLFVSIGIVLVILIVFLGIKDALNAAFCIPMVLGIVFIVGLIFGLDINRITLFALILSLGILVDDSIVMVENNSRHLSLRKKNGKTAQQAILDSVKEVGASIVFSTITRIMSFIAMFAVTGMMGDYMKPIPIFASIALTASLFIAFSINPFLALIFEKNGSHATHESGEGKFLNWYGNMLGRSIRPGESAKKKRKFLKIIFWVGLIVILVTPIMLDIFKARMLPKANKDQIYLWVDAPRDTQLNTMKQIEKSISHVLLEQKENLPENLQIVDFLTSSIGERLLDDFANLFRGGNMRTQEHQLSMRINLISSKKRSLNSEEFVIAIRPILTNAIHKISPDSTIRLLEDPPGPPTQATFHIKVQGEEDSDEKSLVRFSEAIEKTVRALAQEESLVDIGTTLSTAYPEIRIQLDNQRIEEVGLSRENIERTLQIFFQTTPITLLHGQKDQKEAGSILLGFSSNQKQELSSLKQISFINPQGKRIYLEDIANFEVGFTNSEVLTEKQTKTIHIYAELGNNSVVYPIISLYSAFESMEFEKLGYQKISSNPYGIDFIGKEDGKQYKIRWGGEWELTMDTFRDLGFAMILSLLGIYFLIVAQFKSFLVGGIVMTTFLLSFFGIFPGFSLLYLLQGTYFTATAMIGAIALGGIVVGNAIILLDYTNQLLESGKSYEEAIIEGAKKRFVPVMLTSGAAVAGSFIIIGDPVWSGLAWSIIWGLSASAILTLYFIPIFYYHFLEKHGKNFLFESQNK